MAEKKENQKEFQYLLRGYPHGGDDEKDAGAARDRLTLYRDDEEGHGEKGGWRGFSCAEMMREMMKGCCGEKESKETRKEEGHVGDK